MPASEVWPQKHQRIVEATYGRTRADKLSALWHGSSLLATRPLSEICFGTLKVLLDLFGVSTPIVLESELALSPKECSTKEDRLLTLCRLLDCQSYLSGFGASRFLRTERWVGSGIALEWLIWNQRPYAQPFEGWVGDLSAIDLYMCHRDPCHALVSDSRVELCTL